MSALLLITQTDRSVLVECGGEWLCCNISAAAAVLQKLKPENKPEIIIELSKVRRIDTVAATLLLYERNRLADLDCTVAFKNQNDQVEKTLELVSKNQLQLLSQQNDEKLTLRTTSRHFDFAGMTGIQKFFERIGKKTYAVKDDVLQFFAFVGELARAFASYLRSPSSFRFKAFANSIETDGAGAVPIVVISAFLVGVVVAYQAAVQLEKFGASLFIADMVCVSVARELSPLIVAIIVAGRSGSAYTAQLGSMKMTEELDAMRSFGFDPLKFIVIPKIMALSLALPLLIVIADVVAIAGGILIAKLQLGLSPSEFIQRVYEAVSVRHFVIGVLKAPFFAMLISSIACFRGLQTQPNTQSIGYYTTLSVVNSIFAVIACDALFSILLTRLKL